VIFACDSWQCEAANCEVTSKHLKGSDDCWVRTEAAIEQQQTTRCRCL
jgi:hypothetical protein